MLSLITIAMTHVYAPNVVGTTFEGYVSIDGLKTVFQYISYYMFEYLVFSSVTGWLFCMSRQFSQIEKIFIQVLRNRSHVTVSHK